VTGRLPCSATSGDKSKLYALHAPEVECIAKGKVPKRYEFGVKVSIATSNSCNLVVGAQSMPGNPHDGHTLKEALPQVLRLIGQRPERRYVDLGYRGHDVYDVAVYKARQKRGVTRSIRREQNEETPRTVIGRKPGKTWAIIDAGWMAMSADRSTVLSLRPKWLKDR